MSAIYQRFCETRAFAGFPDEIALSIFSYLDLPELAAAQRVCRLWRRLASDEGLWAGLFTRLYGDPVPAGWPVKVAFIARRAQPQDVEVVGAIFFCRLQAGRKRRLECGVVGLPGWSLVMELGFGSRGTEEGFVGPADAVEYAYVRLPEGARRENDLPREHTYEASIPWWGPADLTVPRRLVAVTRGVTSDRWQAMFAAMHARAGEVAVIHRIDVGKGAVLGFVSAINEWRTPFAFERISWEGDDSVWIGRIPQGLFRFVKIAAGGRVVMEKYPSAREAVGRHYSWYNEIGSAPILFPD